MTTGSGGHPPGALGLQAGQAVLTVDPADGGRWTSLLLAGLELLTGVTDPSVDARALSGCFAMAPFAGRLHAGVVEWGGRTARLPLHAPPHAVHGTVLDRVWTPLEHSPGEMVLVTALGPPWPWAGLVRQHVHLRPDGLTALLVLEAAEEMPAVLGWHPWFARRLARGSAARLEVTPTSQYLRGTDGLPTGELVVPPPGPRDDCVVGLAAPPRLVWPGALALTIASDADHWVLYDAHPDAVCVEPQTGPPDAVRLGRETVVPAGGRLTLTMSLQWEPA